MSFHKNSDLPEVEVLLATLDGEMYIKDFLDSLTLQRGVHIHLVVSDDGSKDLTLPIVEGFRTKFKTLKFLTGPKLGPAENFYFLIQNASHEFIALADQDDVWLPNHLQDSIARIRLTHPKPSLTSASVWEIKFDSPEANIWPKERSFDGFPLNFFENNVRGCTIVFNQEFKDFFNEFKNDYALMHDWWIGIIGWCFANFSYSDKPEIIYRIHDKQFVGNSKRNLFHQVVSFCRNKLGAPSLSQMYWIKNYKTINKSPNYVKTLHMIDVLESSIPCRIKIFNSDLIFRTIPYQNLILKLLLFLGVPQLIRRYQR